MNKVTVDTYRTDWLYPKVVRATTRVLSALQMESVPGEEAGDNRTRAVGIKQLEENMKYDAEKIDEATLALLNLVAWREKYGIRAWKSFDWDTMNRLYEKGWISDPLSRVD